MGVDVPEIIGPYRVLRPIATGGTAEVYEVVDPASGERLALKLLVAVSSALQRFNREYEAMTRLNHPSIVRVYHYGLHQGHPWLTMELLRGQPAQTSIKRTGKPGTPERHQEVLRIGYHVARALHYLHDRQLVHRDLKSANVLVLPDDRVKVLDFGAAAMLDQPDQLTVVGEFVGTYAYASPEQIRGRQVDARSDLYSLGVLLFRLATGQRPFESEDPADLARRHLQEAPPDPASVVAGLDRRLADLILSLLAKSPTDRPASAEAVALELEALHGRPFSARSRLAVHDAQATGREQEQRALWEQLAESPPGTLIFVHGDEGSDRTRFLDQVQAAARQRAWGAYRCQLRPGQGLRRLVETLISMAEDSGDPAAAPLIEALAALSSEEALAQSRERAALRQAAASVVRLRTSGGRPALLLLQEIHRADPVTVDLLGGLRRLLHGEDLPFRVVASGRSADLERATDLVRRLGDGRRLALAPLDPRGVAMAVGNMLGRRPPPASLARRLHDLTRGEPLYLEEVVQDLVELGGLEAEGDRLAWAEQAMEVLPPSRATEAALALLVALPSTHRRVLEALTVARDAADPATLAKMLGFTTQEVGEILGRLSAAGAIRWGTDHGLRPSWRDPVVPDLLRRELHPCRLRSLQRALAAAVARPPTTRGGVEATVAAGRAAEALAGVLGLARKAFARSDVRDALELLQVAVARLEPRDTGPEVAEVLILHTRCLLTVSPTDPAAARSLARARQVAEELADPRLLAQVSLAQARVFEVIGHYTNASRHMAAAWEQRPAQDPVLVSEIAVELARSSRRHGQLAKAEQWVVEALEAAERAKDPAAQAAASTEAAACQLARGQLGDAERTLSRAMQLAERAGRRAGYLRALAMRSTVLRHQARFSEAMSQLHQRLPESSQLQDPTPYTELLLAAAWIELDLSRLGRAQEFTDELAATIQRGVHLHLRLEAQLLHGRILMASGQHRSAQYVLQEVHRSARGADLPVLSESARVVLSEALYALGDRDQGASGFQSAVLGLLEAGDLPALSEGCRSRARTQAAERDPDPVFRPVRKMEEDSHLLLLQLERLLAQGTWERARGKKDVSRQLFREAATVLNRVAGDLSDTDRAALRVHPWSAAIRRGLH